MGWLLALVACTEAPIQGAEGESPSATPPPDVSPESVGGDSSPGVPADGDATAYVALFDTRVLHAVRLETSRAAREALAGAPETEVEVDIEVDGVRLEGVGLHLRAGDSLATGKPGLRMDLDAFAPEQRLAGLEHLRLSATSSDPSQLRGVLASELLAALVIPSPRGAFAWVTLDDEALGLYVLEERVDGDFLGRGWTDDSGDLWEGASGADLRQPGIERYARVHGDGRGGRVVLRRAAAALVDPARDVVPAAEEVLDLDQWMGAWGAAIALRHGGAYPWDTGHDVLYVDPADGRLDTITVDWDRAWDSSFTWREVRTQVGARCVADSACRDRLREAARASIDAVEALDPVARAQALVALTADAVRADPRRSASAESVEAAREVLLTELAGAAEAARGDLGR